MIPEGVSQSSYKVTIPETPTEIGIVTPAPAGSRRGNRITAERWDRLLGELGYAVQIGERYSGEPFAALIVLHAARSESSIREWRRRFPDRPLFVAVTGTDIYGEEFDARIVQESLALATRIIVLQPRTLRDLPDNLRENARIIYQSAEPPPYRQDTRDDRFEVAVVGHLRPVKDPFRAAEAVRLLPASSQIQIVHLGAAMSADMADRALRETTENPRYEWLGDLTHAETLAVMARCRLVVLTSLAEGGPAVIAEAIIADVPMLATRVSGNVGMLGDDYPGLFPAGDTAALAGLLDRAERVADFYDVLRIACQRRRPLFEPAAERAAWSELLAEVGVGPVRRAA